MKIKMHLGCRIMHPENARLTRSTYSILDDTARRNTYTDAAGFTGMSPDEANRLYFKTTYQIHLKSINHYIKWVNNLQTNARIQKEALKEYKSHILRCRHPVITENDIVTVEDILVSRWNMPSFLKVYQNVRNSRSLLLDSEDLRLFAEEYDAPYHSEQWCLERHRRNLEDYDRSMQYYKTLSHSEFETALETLKHTCPQLCETDDIRPYNLKPGICIMVLDEICQIHIAAASDKAGLKGRIQQFWYNKIPFDRLHLPCGENIRIDSFMQYDTTRVMMLPVESTEHLQNTLSAVRSQFPKKFMSNAFLLRKIQHIEEF